MEKNDGLSEIICKKCLARLQIAYDFKNDAIASNRDLRSFISNVNKQFQQVTGSSSAIVAKSKRTSQKDGESEMFDELEEDMQALIDDEQEIEFKDIDTDLSDDTKKTIDRDQLVEILGDNNAITIRKTRSGRTIAIQEDVTDEPPENMEVFLVEETNEVESGYIVDEYEQNAGELITDETDEPQYLEDDDNDDQLYEPVSYWVILLGRQSKKMICVLNKHFNVNLCIFPPKNRSRPKAKLHIKRQHEALAVRIKRIAAMFATRHSAHEPI